MATISGKSTIKFLIIFYPVHSRNILRCIICVNNILRFRKCYGEMLKYKLNMRN